MKVSRNEPCSCGSGKKYKNCCGKDVDEKQSFLSRNLIPIIFAVVLGATVFGFITFFQEDHPEMEAYKCDNPNCGKIHYRQKTDSN